MLNVFTFNFFPQKIVMDLKTGNNLDRCDIYLIYRQPKRDSRIQLLNARKSLAVTRSSL